MLDREEITGPRYEFKDKETGEVFATIAEPEFFEKTKTVFEFFQAGDIVKLDPEEAKDPFIKGRVDLNKTYTVKSARPSVLKANNPSKFQTLKLDTKVLASEDPTGWSNSWFTKA